MHMASNDSQPSFDFVKSFTAELKLLTEMHQLGQLTDEEFTAAKSKILEK